MKIAVCYSGLCRGDWVKNHNSVRHHFPTADYFFSTWNHAVVDMPALIEYTTYPEPKMHYHPWGDVPPEQLTWKAQQLVKNDLPKPYYRERTLHHTKQILAHAYQLENDVPKEYDMIVRVRYDAYVSPKVDFTEYLNRAYENKLAVGFGTRTKRHPNLHEFKELPKEWPGEKGPHDSHQYIMDPMIIHHRDVFDPSLAWKLHNEKKLMPAENGWWQVVSEPYGDNHYSVYGGVQVQKYL